MNINFGLLETTSLYCITGTTSSTIDREKLPIDYDNLSTIATSVATTLSVGGVNNINIQLESTRNYVSQMSVQELDDILVSIEERENNIIDNANESVKVKTLGSKKI